MNVDVIDGEGCLARASSPVTPNEVCTMCGSVVVHGVGVRAGVGVVIRGAGDRILLEKRRDCGWWGLPGGKVEPGEALIDADVREVCEEMGLAERLRTLSGCIPTPVAAS